MSEQAPYIYDIQAARISHTPTYGMLAIANYRNRETK